MEDNQVYRTRNFSESTENTSVDSCGEKVQKTEQLGLSEAAKLMLHEYKIDIELTAFTDLDGELVHE